MKLTHNINLIQNKLGNISLFTFAHKLSIILTQLFRQYKRKSLIPRLLWLPTQNSCTKQEQAEKHERNRNYYFIQLCRHEMKSVWIELFNFQGIRVLMRF